jgi:hypothetical protein
MQVPVPVLVGVNNPSCVMVPPVAVHVTPLLYDPVPVTVAEHVDVCALVMEDGAATTLTLVTVG